MALQWLDFLVFLAVAYVAMMVVMCALGAIFMAARYIFFQLIKGCFK